MMANLTHYLQKIYGDIAQDLSKEIGDLFKSGEGKGSYNVSRLLERMEHHLPAKYSFTRGTELFDRDGSHTSAKDFVIYDRTKNLFLSHSSDPTVLPVDTVYAVFEVKTTLNAKELSRAVKQVQEVKKLHYIKKTLVHAEVVNDRLCETKRETGPPIGVIVAYDTVWKTKETLENRLIKTSSQLPETERWDLFYVIDQAFLAVTQLLSGNRLAKYVSFVNLRPGFQELDLGAAFLNFLLSLQSRLSERYLRIPTIDYREDYKLGDWLWHMHATSFYESGDRIPRQDA